MSCASGLRLSEQGLWECGCGGDGGGGGGAVHIPFCAAAEVTFGHHVQSDASLSGEPEPGLSLGK